MGAVYESAFGHWGGVAVARKSDGSHELWVGNDTDFGIHIYPLAATDGAILDVRTTIPFGSFALTMAFDPVRQRVFYPQDLAFGYATQGSIAAINVETRALDQTYSIPTDQLPPGGVLFMGVTAGEHGKIVAVESSRSINPQPGDDFVPSRHGLSVWNADGTGYRFIDWVDTGFPYPAGSFLPIRNILWTGNSPAFRTDTIAPVADPMLLSSPNGAGWYNAPVTVTWNWDDGNGVGIDPANCTTSSTSSADGKVTLSASCADLAGNQGSSSLVVEVDTTAPETTFTVTPPASTTETNASFSLGGSDAISGLAGFECQLDGAAFAPCTSPQAFSDLALGSHTFTARSIDVAGNVDATPASFTWSIVAIPTTISWSGALQPINADGSSVFKAGSVVPVKFRLTGADAGRTDLVARLSYARISNSVAGPVNEASAPGNGTSGNVFLYDPASGQYYFNWSTKGLTAGTYELIIDLGDGNPHRVRLGLR